jgi:hypothetical protein
MRKSAILVGGVSAILAIGAAAIAALLFYYRPTVEYAYVDILDLRDRQSLPFPGWVLLAAPLAGAALLIFAYRIWRRRAAW